MSGAGYSPGYYGDGAALSTNGQAWCAGNMIAWQYELGSGANPDVDHDQALSKLPLWFP